MVAKEFSKQGITVDVDDAEDTLSLCDLASDRNISDLDDFLKEDRSSRFDQDSFEFSSGELTATSSMDSILFFGKLIPDRGATVTERSHSQDVQTKPKNTQKIRDDFLLMKSVSFNKSSSVSPVQMLEKGYSKSCKTLPTRVGDNREEYTARKMNVDRYFSTGKGKAFEPKMKSSTRYMFAFGGAGLPVGMKMSDIKSRQRKRSPANMFSCDDSEAGIVRTSSKGSGLLGLLRRKVFLGCIPQF